MFYVVVVSIIKAIINYNLLN